MRRRGNPDDPFSSDYGNPDPFQQPKTIRSTTIRSPKPKLAVSEVVNLYFCGTDMSSERLGYVIADFARAEVPGEKNINWIIIDGPGTPAQVKECWAQPRDKIPIWQGVATGAGWEENAEFAVNFLQSKMSPNYSNVAIADHVFDNTLVRGLTCPIRQINLIGHSRGGVTCMMVAEMLNKISEFRDVKVRILAFDPVPGMAGMTQFELPSNVIEYVGVYAQDERTVIFDPIIPHSSNASHKSLRFETIIMPGRHSTVAGNVHEMGVGKNAAPNPLRGLGSIHWIVYYITYHFLVEPDHPAAISCSRDRFDFPRMNPQAPTERRITAADSMHDLLFHQETDGIALYPPSIDCFTSPLYILSCYDYVVGLRDKGMLAKMRETTYGLRPQESRQLKMHPTAAARKYFEQELNPDGAVGEATMYYPFINMHHFSLCKNFEPDFFKFVILMRKNMKKSAYHAPNSYYPKEFFKPQHSERYPNLYKLCLEAKP